MKTWNINKMNTWIYDEVLYWSGGAAVGYGVISVSNSMAALSLASRSLSTDSLYDKVHAGV